METFKFYVSRVLIALGMAVALHACRGAWAQGVPIGALPSATTPLSGSELTILSQNSTTVKTPVSQLAGPGITILNNRLLGNVSGITAPAIGLTSTQVSTFLGLGTAAFTNVGSSGHTVPFLDVGNTWSALQTFSGGISLPSLSVTTLGVTGTATIGTLSVTTGGAAITGRTVFSGSGGFYVSGSVATGLANATLMDYSSGTSRIFNLGADGSTLPTGGFNFIVAHSDTSGSSTLASLTASALTVNVGASFAGNSSVTGTLIVTSSLTSGPSALIVNTGGLGGATTTASASAPGAAGGKIEWRCGTAGGSIKIVAYGGTSSTGVTVIDNVGTGVSGC